MFHFSENTSFLPATEDRTHLWALQEHVTRAEHSVGAVWVLQHPQLIEAPISHPAGATWPTAH